MTPEEYIEVEREQRAIIEAARRDIIRPAEKIIENAREAAENASPPLERLRPAVASDIRPGLLVWHQQEEKYGGWYWHIVEEPKIYGDDFKAYIADDGARYGLHRAWVLK